MAQKRNALGRGLDASIFQMDENVQTESFASDPTKWGFTKLSSNQGSRPRHEFDKNTHSGTCRLNLLKYSNALCHIGLFPHSGFYREAAGWPGMLRSRPCLAEPPASHPQPGTIRILRDP